MSFVYSNIFRNFADRLKLKSVYGYVPSLASFILDKQQLEGVGISPDIEVDFDMPVFESTGRDIQLERALQFIRSGE